MFDVGFGNVVFEESVRIFVVQVDWFFQKSNDNKDFVIILLGFGDIRVFVFVVEV